MTPEAIAADEAIVKENRRVTVNGIAAYLGVSHGSAHHIVHDVLQFHSCDIKFSWIITEGALFPSYIYTYLINLFSLHFESIIDKL